MNGSIDFKIILMRGVNDRGWHIFHRFVKTKFLGFSSLSSHIYGLRDLSLCIRSIGPFDLWWFLSNCFYFLIFQTFIFNHMSYGSADISLCLSLSKSKISSPKCKNKGHIKTINHPQPLKSKYYQYKAVASIWKSPPPISWLNIDKNHYI